MVVDRLTKQAIFILTQRSIDANGLAEIFMKNIFSKHKVPAHITSDKGTEFISRFFKSLASALNMKLHFTSGYYSEADGQTEHINQTLKQYLRIYCNYQQSDWAHLLPLVEFTYNNASSVTMGISLFFTNKGYHSCLDIQVNQAPTPKTAQHYTANLKEVHVELKCSVVKAQECY